MDFRSELERLCAGVPGARAASIMGLDGIPIDHVEPAEGGGIDTSALVVEYSGLLGQVKASAQMLAAGELEEVTVRAERLACVMRTVTAEFFVAVVLDQDASIGRARHALRLLAPRFRSELS